MNDASPTVFVVAEDAELRESLTRLLQPLRIATRVCPSGTEFLREYQPTLPGCLVCDVRLSDMSGLELYERLASAGAPLPVIFMTGCDDLLLAVQALSSRAVEIVEKPFAPQAMLERIERALAEDIERRADDSRWREFNARLKSLTDKEREVLTMILDGAPNKAIAAKAEITERAVEMRRASVMRKLQVHSLAELIRLVTRHEVIAEARAKRRWP